ncbi:MULTISPECIES: DUF58 domain-containing protein [unclassified Pseudofrankia]|uniref:DUF58 domain-containing protein n=1 Tax=unclassified Pseudofrankia TaxID=2994372 RepID=UPI0008D9D372|nr:MULTISPECIES: DUF58 domain-containing protein [unclassified Pseudofrankia]MDT3443932.1 DUF58 domain-containing protein [Pseudofrankia sp. BMG5.37]OHV68213.1 hypothetical protein BCD48_03265 [Pseudofrankia sp. BMG5.36]
MPTTTGWGISVGALVLATAGYLLGYPELVVLAVGCLLAVAAGLLVVARPAHVSVSLDLAPSRVARGGDAWLIVSLRNRGARPTPRLALEVTLDWATGTNSIARSIGALASGDDWTVTFALPTARRGFLRAGPATIRVQDPFGLAERRRSVSHGGVTLSVHPVTVALPAPTSSGNRGPDGATSDAAPDGAVTFRALRDYRPGDDLRRVHWRSSAKLGNLLVREHVEPALPLSTVLLDCRRSAYRQTGEPAGAEDDLFELAGDVAGSVALASSSRRYPLRLRTSDGLRLDTHEWDAGAAPVLDFLTRAGLNDTPTLNVALARIGRTGPSAGRGMLTLVTGERAAGELTATSRAARLFDRVTVIQVVGRTPPPGTSTGPNGSDGGPVVDQKGRVTVCAVSALADLPQVWNRATSTRGRPR